MVCSWDPKCHHINTIFPCPTPNFVYIFGSVQFWTSEARKTRFQLAIPYIPSPRSFHPVLALVSSSPHFLNVTLKCLWTIRKKKSQKYFMDNTNTVYKQKLNKVARLLFMTLESWIFFSESSWISAQEKTWYYSLCDVIYGTDVYRGWCRV